MTTPKLFNIFLGDEPVGAGYATREEAVKAARRLAAKHGSLPMEIRPVGHIPNHDGDSDPRDA